MTERGGESLKAKSLTEVLRREDAQTLEVAVFCVVHFHDGGGNRS